jgi:hypothetical protein
MGVKVDMAMAKAEGWIDKTGSKWKTMPQLMLRYRAATFFGRVYCPEILMGMHTEEEVEDFTDMATMQQEDKIYELLNTSTISPEERKWKYEFKIKHGISQGEAIEMIHELRGCQLPAKDLPQMNMGDVNRAIVDAIEVEE